ncbi:MAG: vWA domain-containing protein [Crocosphaera sp.]
MKKTQKILKFITKFLKKSRHRLIFIFTLLLTISLISYSLVNAQEISSSAKKLKKLELISLKKEQQTIILRLKAMGQDKQPIMDLTQDDFKIEVSDARNDKLLFSDLGFRWKSPQDTVPNDAYIVVLFDMSGSMKCSTDLETGGCAKIAVGERKFDAAIAILKQFIEDAKKWRGKTQVSIVPFGYGTKDAGCKFDESFVTVTKEKVKKFASVANTNLDDLASKTPCTATNIYDSLDKTVEVLTNTNDGQFYPLDPNGKLTSNQPRLSIILFTDGFDSNPKYFHKNEAVARNLQQQKLENIRSRLTKNPQLSIYALGYGLTPEQLGNKYNLGRAANWNTDIDWDNNKSKTIPKEEYLDKVALEKIGALTTLGRAKIAGETQEITEILELFIKSILGEYEIIYNHPNPQKGRGYKVRSRVNNISSNDKLYRFSLVDPVVSPNIFLGAFGLGMLFLGGWFGVYLLWKKQLQG